MGGLLLYQGATGAASGGFTLARSKKVQKKASPEERMLDRWDQQVFFFKKQFPDAVAEIVKIQKAHTKSKNDDFFPTEDALNELNHCYLDLKQAPQII